NDAGDSRLVGRREFLRLGATGMLLSVLPVRSPGGTTVDEVTFASDGFSLTLDVPDRGTARVRSLRNPKTGFEWCRAGAQFGPLQVHTVNRESYSLETRPVPAAGSADPVVDISGGGWNSPGQSGLIVLEAANVGESLFVGIEWERDWYYRITRDSDGLWLTVA